MTNQANIEIKAFARNTGKGNSRGLRKDRMIPAIIYGPAVENVPFSLAQNDAVKYSSHKFDNVVLTLKSDEKKLNGVKVLMKSHDVHPRTHLPIHVDFYAPNMKEVVRVNVELTFEGKAAGMAEGGILNAIKHDIEIECLPNDIPDHISVDITPIELNGSLHVSDLKVPAGIKIMTAPELTLCTVAAVEEVQETPVAAEATEGAEAAPAEEKK